MPASCIYPRWILFNELSAKRFWKQSLCYKGGSTLWSTSKVEISQHLQIRLLYRMEMQGWRHGHTSLTRFCSASSPPFQLTDWPLKPITNTWSVRAGIHCHYTLWVLYHIPNHARVSAGQKTSHNAEITSQLRNIARDMHNIRGYGQPRLLFREGRPESRDNSTQIQNNSKQRPKSAGSDTALDVTFTATAEAHNCFNDILILIIPLQLPWSLICPRHQCFWQGFVLEANDVDDMLQQLNAIATNFPHG